MNDSIKNQLQAIRHLIVTKPNPSPKPKKVVSQ